jgi:hypothetical protein
VSERTGRVGRRGESDAFLFCRLHPLSPVFSNPAASPPFSLSLSPSHPEQFVQERGKPGKFLREAELKEKMDTKAAAKAPPPAAGAESEEESEISSRPAQGGKAGTSGKVRGG